jgi:hypothetical protein
MKFCIFCEDSEDSITFDPEYKPNPAQQSDDSHCCFAVCQKRKRGNRQRLKITRNFEFTS